jgi:hypothetical protein
MIAPRVYLAPNMASGKKVTLQLDGAQTRVQEAQTGGSTTTRKSALPIAYQAHAAFDAAGLAGEFASISSSLENWENRGQGRLFFAALTTDRRVRAR